MSDTIIDLTDKFRACQSSLGSTNKAIRILKRKHQTAKGLLCSSK